MNKAQIYRSPQKHIKSRLKQVKSANKPTKTKMLNQHLDIDTKLKILYQSISTQNIRIRQLEKDNQNLIHQNNYLKSINTKVSKQQQQQNRNALKINQIKDYYQNKIKNMRNQYKQKLLQLEQKVFAQSSYKYFVRKQTQEQQSSNESQQDVPTKFHSIAEKQIKALTKYL